MGAREIHFHKAVHAYKRGSHVYFLNSANGAWVAMPSSYAKCLMEEQDIVNHSKEYMYAYDTLANASIIQDVQHAEKQSICEHKPLIVQFQTTGECNLQCIYCFNEPSLRTHVMSETIMKQSVDYVYSHPQACYGVHFSIYGGEPLMQRDLLYSTIRYIRKKQPDKNTTISVITNGTLLTSEDVSFFLSQNAIVNVSFDGLPCFQDQNRKDKNARNTSEQVLSAIGKLKHLPNLSILTTVTHEMSSKLLDIVLFAEENGFPGVEFMPLRMLGTAENNNSLTVDVKAYIKAMMEIVEAIEEKQIKQTAVRALLRMLYPLETMQTVHGEIGCARCGAGRDTILITCSGEIKGCDMLPEHHSPVIGNVWDGITALEKLDCIVQPGYTKLKACSQCIWNRYCRSGCTGASASDQDDYLSKHEMTCMINKALYPYLLEKLATDGGVLHEYFLTHTTSIYDHDGVAKE